jgi:hypothetical protein
MFNILFVEIPLIYGGCSFTALLWLGAHKRVNNYPAFVRVR